MQSSDLLVAGRRRAGLSQMQLAERLGRPQATIARWEKGSQHPLTGPRSLVHLVWSRSNGPRLCELGGDQLVVV